MSRTAMSAPAHVIAQRNALGNVQQQPDAAPSLAYGGGGLLDSRLPYNLINSSTGAQILGWYGAGSTLCVNQVPSTAAVNNIGAAANVASGTAMTLVSASGAGITVLAAATLAFPSLNTIAAGTLAVDGAFGVVRFGIRDITAFYDPTKAISRVLSVTGSSSATGGAFKFAGFDLYGFPQTETITHPGGTVTQLGKKSWKYVTSVTPQFTDAHNYSIGTSDVFGFPLRSDNWAFVDPVFNGQAIIGGGAGTSTIVIPVQFSDWLTTATTYAISPGFNGKLTSALLRVYKAGAGAGASEALQLQVNGVSLTGGALTATLASTTQNAALAFSAITAGTQTFLAGQTIGYTNASGGTVFTGGDGAIEFSTVNTDSLGSNHTAADTTSPATSTTGDVRGTFALPGATITSGGSGTLTSVSNGVASLQIYISPTLAGVANATSQPVGLFGVAPA